MLELIELTVARGGVSIVDGLSLVLRPGRIFWIVGPNGAGKSSLLRVMAGLDRARGGRVVDRRDPREPRHYFYSEMALPEAGTPRDWERLVRRLAPGRRRGDRTALWPDVDERRPVARLSTGERKRLLLDVLLRRPASLLLDEPFEHLSPDAKGVLGRLLRELARCRLVVVATNQATERAAREGGLRLEAGAFELLGGDPAGRSGPGPGSS